MFGGRAGRYHLAQTRMPSADSRRCIVVTSIPSEPSAALQVTSGPPELINLLISTENKREAEEKNAAQWQPFEPPVRPPGEEPGTPVVDPDLPPGLKPGETVRIGADGKIRMPPPSKPNLGVSASGRPCDVKKLLEETIDWAATPLGPMCRWSRTMQTFVGAMMASSNNSAMWYGREFTLMYNQHFANVSTQNSRTADPRPWRGTTRTRLGVMDRRHGRASRTRWGRGLSSCSTGRHCTSNNVSTPPSRQSNVQAS